MFRILIVDDEKIVLNGIKLLIEKRMQLPFVPDIAIASSAATALELLSVFQPDLILSDIRMPVIDGFAFIEQVKKRDIICDFAILTSHADFNYAKRAITLHVEDFILKPVETAELQQVLLNCHAKKEQRRKAEEKEGFSLLRNLLLYDLPIEQLISEEELFRSIFPYKYFTVDRFPGSRFYGNNRKGAVLSLPEMPYLLFLSKQTVYYSLQPRSFFY